MNIFKGYVRTKNKRAIDPYKGVSNLRTLEEVENLEEYAGVLSDDVVMIDIDDHKQAEKLYEIIEKENIELPIDNSLDAFVMYVSDTEKEYATTLVQELRMNGFKVDTEYTGRGLKGQFKQADRLNSKFLIILNDEDLTPEEKVGKLIRKWNARGGTDNISVAYLVKESGE